MPDWKLYQEEVAAFFRSLGLQAETDERMQGVRTTHDIDVVVRFRHSGFDILWLVECKLWKEPVSKLHILGFREILHDMGADRGIILAENGFQSGARQASVLTNVQLTSLSDLKVSAKNDICAVRARDISERIEICHAEYWELDKQFRKDRGLRPHFGETGYNGATVIDLSRDIMREILRGAFPIQIGKFYPAIYNILPPSITSLEQAVDIVDSMIFELEAKLAAAKT